MTRNLLVLALLGLALLSVDCGAGPVVEDAGKAAAVAAENAARAAEAARAAALAAEAARAAAVAAEAARAAAVAAAAAKAFTGVDAVVKVTGRSSDDVTRMLAKAKQASKAEADLVIARLDAHEPSSGKVLIKTAAFEVLKEYAATGKIPDGTDDLTIALKVGLKLGGLDRFTTEDSRAMLAQARSAAANDNLYWYVWVLAWCVPGA